MKAKVVFFIKWQGITFLMAKIWMWWLELEQPHWVLWRKMDHAEGGETKEKEPGLSLLWAIIAAWITSLDCYKKEKYKYFVFSVTCSWICVSIEVSWKNRWEVIRWNFYSFCHCFIFFLINNQHLIECCMKDSTGWSGIILKDRVGSRHHKQSSIVKKNPSGKLLQHYCINAAVFDQSHSRFWHVCFPSWEQRLCLSWISLCDARTQSQNPIPPFKPEVWCKTYKTRGHCVDGHGIVRLTCICSLCAVLIKNSLVGVPRWSSD